MGALQGYWGYQKGHITLVPSHGSDGLAHILEIFLPRTFHGLCYSRFLARSHSFIL